MNTNNKTLGIALLTLIIGFGLGYLVTKEPEMNDAGEGINHNMISSMDSMMSGLEGKTGDEFDRSFIEEMIVHHQGAVAMAQLALENAKHEEIKSMANAIISAQTSEITQMKAWLKNWYGEE